MKKPILLFARRYLAPSGGQYKVRDYFEHARASGIVDPRIYITADSTKSSESIWSPYREYWVNSFDYRNASGFFLAGPDWRFLTRFQCAFGRKPRINLIQDFWPTDSSHATSKYLRYGALRICVSEPLREAISNLVKDSRSVVCIPGGIPDLGRADVQVTRTYAVTVFASKDPEFGRQIFRRLQSRGLNVLLLTDAVNRDEYLKRIRESDLCVFIPLRLEGLYLPPLEAMALGVRVVCPDCLGNRTYSVEGENGYFPPFDADSIEVAVLSAVQQNVDAKLRMRMAGAATARRHSLESERNTFHAMLNRLFVG